MSVKPFSLPTWLITGKTRRSSSESSFFWAASRSRLRVVLEPLEGDRLLLVALLERVALVVGQSLALVGELLLHLAQLLGELVRLFLLLVVELLDPVEGLLAERRLLDEPLDVDDADASAPPPGPTVPWALATAATQGGQPPSRQCVSFQLLLQRKRGSVANNSRPTQQPAESPSFRAETDPARGESTVTQPPPRSAQPTASPSSAPSSARSKRPPDREREARGLLLQVRHRETVLVEGLIGCRLKA